MKSRRERIGSSRRLSVSTVAPLRDGNVTLTGPELSRVAADATHPTVTEMTASENYLKKDSRQPRWPQRLIGRLLPPLSANALAGNST